MPLVDAAADEGIEFIDTRHEGAAMHMADAYARITGQPSVAMFTGGPGYANAISGLPAIFTSESPVIFVAGKREAEEKTFSIRRLGTKEQVSMTLDDAIRHMVDEGTPPDLLPEARKAAAE